jgi:hypothetical protein
MCWERERVEPGDTVRAIIVPMSSEAWTAVEDGDELVMYEGHRVGGHATVLWRTPLDAWPLEESESQPFREWARTGIW